LRAAPSGQRCPIGAARHQQEEADGSDHHWAEAIAVQQVGHAHSAQANLPTGISMDLTTAISMEVQQSGAFSSNQVRQCMQAQQ
jgi:hypothetical protein